MPKVNKLIPQDQVDVSALQNDIDNETAARVLKDQSLDQDILQEQFDRSSADTALTDAMGVLNTAINNEAATRAADDLLRVLIDDIINNVTSTDVNKPLSAAQGKVLKDLIDTLSPFNPDTTIEIYSDFLTSVSDNASNSEGFVSSLSGAGATAGNNVSPDALNRQGINRCATGGVATNRAGFVTNSSIVVGGGEITFQCDVRVPTLSTGTDRFTIRAGLHDTVTDDQSNGIYFLLDEGGVSTGSTASGNWYFVTVTGSSRTFTDTGIASVANTFFNLKFVINAAGTSISVYVNHSLVATVTTNIPTGTPKPLFIANMIQKSIGTGGRQLDTDYIYFKQVFTTPR